MKNAIIDIVKADHTYTATVRFTSQLEDYCSDLVAQGVEFRIGSIQSYGDHDTQVLNDAIRRIERFGTYNRHLSK